MNEVLCFLNKLKDKLKNKNQSAMGYMAPAPDELRIWLRSMYLPFCRVHMMNNNSNTYRQYRSGCRVMFGVDLVLDRPVKARPVCEDLQMELF